MRRKDKIDISLTYFVFRSYTTHIIRPKPAGPNEASYLSTVSKRGNRTHSQHPSTVPLNCALSSALIFLFFFSLLCYLFPSPFLLSFLFPSFLTFVCLSAPLSYCISLTCLSDKPCMNFQHSCGDALMYNRFRSIHTPHRCCEYARGTVPPFFSPILPQRAFSIIYYNSV